LETCFADSSEQGEIMGACVDDLVFELVVLSQFVMGRTCRESAI